MKIVSGDASIKIDFVEGYKTYNNELGGLFLIRAEVKTATFSGIAKNIWYAYDEFEQFIRDLKRIVEKGSGTVMLQPPTEASEDYALISDGLNLRFSMEIAPHLACYVNVGVYRSDAYLQVGLQMLNVAFGISSSNIASLISDFESFKGIVLEELARLAKEENDKD